MAQDLKHLFKDASKNEKAKMSGGHEAKFLKQLNKALPQQKTAQRFSFLKIAASVIILLGLSYGAFKILPNSITTNNPTEVVDTNLKTLGDFSPGLKKVEDYYLASINLELSKVKLTPENKELFDGYIQRLKELDNEYNKLILELNENGPNEATLDALINNLKLRLNLVMRLKEKLKTFSTETFTEESV